MPNTKTVNLPYDIWRKAKDIASATDDGTIRGVIINWIEKGLELESEIRVGNKILELEKKEAKGD